MPFILQTNGLTKKIGSKIIFISPKGKFMVFSVLMFQDTY